MKKALEPIHDRETEETVYKLTINYIEFVKKTHEKIYKATQAEGQKEIYDKFSKYTKELLGKLEKDVEKIVVSTYSSIAYRFKIKQVLRKIVQCI